MKLHQLREVFRVAEKQYLNDGNRDAAAALSTFGANLLRKDENSTVADFVKRIEKARKQALSTSTAAKRSQRSTQRKRTS